MTAACGRSSFCEIGAKVGRKGGMRNKAVKVREGVGMGTSRGPHQQRQGRVAPVVRRILIVQQGQFTGETDIREGDPLAHQGWPTALQRLLHATQPDAQRL